MLSKTWIDAYVDAMFGALEAQYPAFSGILQAINGIMDSLGDYLVSQLGNLNVLTLDAVLTVAIDAATASGHVMVAAALSALKSLIDQQGVAQRIQDEIDKRLRAQGLSPAMA